MKAADLIKIFRDASLAKAQAIAIARAADAIPAVVDDLAAKSVDRQVSCPTCAGTGSTVSVVTGAAIDCPTCRKTGTVLRESELDRQKTLLDMLGLGKKQAPGTKIINTNAQVNAGSVGALFSTFVKQSDHAAYDVDMAAASTGPGPGEAADAEVIDGE